MKSVNSFLESASRRIELLKAEKSDAKLTRPVVVIESDDWGSIRMPSTQILDELKAKGYNYADYIGYDLYDTLASNEDLEVLIDTLLSVKGADGQPAKLTMNCVVANPDFDKIRQSGFKEYHYELFIDTLRRYPHHDRSFSLWKEGMKQGVLRPQFHGREHLNAQMWMKLLQKGCKPIIDSFDKGVISVIVDMKDDPRQHSLAAYNLATEDEYAFAKNSVIEGLAIFEELFGYRSESMIAPNYTWDTAIEEAAFICGVRYIQGGRSQRHSYYVNQNGGRNTIRYTGQVNNYGQIYTVRNCMFEPSENPRHGVDYCMSQVKKAFSRRQAAIISVHRQNFIGELYPLNRENNIRLFRDLLVCIIAKYPDVVFMSSDEFGRLIESGIKN